MWRHYSWQAITEQINGYNSELDSCVPLREFIGVTKRIWMQQSSRKKTILILGTEMEYVIRWRCFFCYTECWQSVTWRTMSTILNQKKKKKYKEIWAISGLEKETYKEKNIERDQKGLGLFSMENEKTVKGTEIVCHHKSCYKLFFATLQYLGLLSDESSEKAVLSPWEIMKSPSFQKDQIMLIFVTAILEQRPRHSDIFPDDCPSCSGFSSIPQILPRWGLAFHMGQGTLSTDRFTGSILCGKAWKIQSVFL